MAKLRTKKIEDVFNRVSDTVDFDDLKEPETVFDSRSRNPISFPQVLDFAFPLKFGEENIRQVGEVIYVGDGVCQIRGLDSASIDEVVEITTNTGIIRALVLGVQEEKVEAVVVGDFTVIKRGDSVKTTGKTLQMPVGKGMLGRVVDPLGNPIDGKGPIKNDGFWNVEYPAPGVMDRQPVVEPLITGIMSIDTTIPIGRGQRELVIGDRKTGKSRTMLDIITNQKGKGVLCVYVGVGIQGAKARGTYELLKEREALSYTTLLFSFADDPPSMQYLSPYSGTAVAEKLMYDGNDVLIIYDDLSKQAKAYRQVSLLLKRSPSRDAYPGDIFFLHSRLLERASKLSDEYKAGSITALPIAETQSGDVSDYIVTNLMSITDGHIYLDANLKNEGILPAVNSGTSVSRIGSKVQSKLLAKVGELTGNVLARYDELKTLETINTEIAEETLREIQRGKRIREILSQDSNLNLTADEEVIILAIANSRRMDGFDLEQAVVFKDNIVEFYRDNYKAEMEKMCNTAKKMEEIDSKIDEMWARFTKKFSLPPGEANKENG